MVLFYFWIGCYEYNKFVDFLKLFTVLDMDGSFPMSLFMFVFGFTADELQGFQDFSLILDMLSTSSNVAKSVQIYPKLPKFVQKQLV
jgi:hypothetical protein